MDVDHDQVPATKQPKAGKACGQHLLGTSKGTVDGRRSGSQQRKQAAGKAGVTELRLRKSARLRRPGPRVRRAAWKGEQRQAALCESARKPSGRRARQADGGRARRQSQRGKQAAPGRWEVEGRRAGEARLEGGVEDGGGGAACEGDEDDVAEAGGVDAQEDAVPG